MKKTFLLFAFLFAVFSVFSVYAAVPDFYFDEYGQLKPDGNQAQQDCFRRGHYYWDGGACREIVPVKTCKARGGEWQPVQMVVRRYFKYVCLCPHNKFWNGNDCVSNLPQDKKCRIEVWCDPKMSDIFVNVTPEIMDLTVCPR